MVSGGLSLSVELFATDDRFMETMGIAAFNCVSMGEHIGAK